MKLLETRWSRIKAIVVHVLHSLTVHALKEVLSSEAVSNDLPGGLICYSANLVPLARRSLIKGRPRH